jgi:hypothetical protein
MTIACFARTLCLLVLTLVFHIAAFANNTASAEKRGVAVEYTFLKSAPGEREALKKFIIANWFKMDAIAAERGLMSAYEVLDSGDDAEPWNVMVAVTYMNRAGYEGIATEFEKIRRDHKPTLIDGKGFKDLGKIVSSRKLYRE